jgi:hypothetical protein
MEAVGHLSNMLEAMGLDQGPNAPEGRPEVSAQRTGFPAIEERLENHRRLARRLHLYLNALRAQVVG